ncbi:hypothetical protein PIB30_075303 [Stylosanthes scabra]|uniref:Uncharacterized protein n=1 Tax=Stylosanthes scabra TaxID=79078 RepID=A0ABU6UNR9_9FABA|nr:hypothetical protein [Stylosanthes scabra]
MAPATVLGPVYPVLCTPMCDARRYRSLFSRHRVTPLTPPPPSPPSIDDEPSTETYDPTAELEGDPDEPYVAERVLRPVSEAYYSDASYESERESASAGSAPSSHHSSGSSSRSVSVGYGFASSGSASGGASDTIWVSSRVVLLSPVPFCEFVVVPVALVLECDHDIPKVGVLQFWYQSGSSLLSLGWTDYATLHISECVRHVYRHPVDARDVIIVRCWWFTQRMATSRHTESRARTNNDLPASSEAPTELIPQVSHREATLIHGECYIRGERLSVLYDSGATHSFLSNRAVARVGLVPESLGIPLAVHTPASPSAYARKVCRNVVIDIMLLNALRKYGLIYIMAIRPYA